MTKKDNDYFVKELPAQPDWLALGALCLTDPNVDPDWWNASEESHQRLGLTVAEQEELAIATCARCPVKIECGNYGQEMRMVEGDRAFGIYGGIKIRNIRVRRVRRAS